MVGLPYCRKEALAPFPVSYVYSAFTDDKRTSIARSFTGVLLGTGMTVE
jgi:hypothetical protein